jgi:hypothetical protein
MMKKLLTFLIALVISNPLWAASVEYKSLVGVMSADIKWEINHTGTDILYALLKLRPNEHVPTCSRLSFIQIAKLTVNGSDYVWADSEGQSNRNLILTKKQSGIEPGYFIDHNASLCTRGKSCSPFYRDSWANEEESQDGASTNFSKKAASLFDAPYGWERFEEIKLEACAVCQNGEELKVLSCVEWGGKWPLIEQRQILPI